MQVQVKESVAHVLTALSEPIPSRPVHSELEQLLVLQDRDQKIRQIQNEIKTLPLQRQNLESQRASSTAAVER